MDTKKCQMCGLEIPQRAHVCSHCDHYQGWRRLCKNAGVLFAVVPLVASAVFFTLDKWDTLVAAKIGEAELTLLACDSNDDVSILNSGSRDIVVHYLVYESSDGAKMFLPVNQKLPHDEVIVVDARDNKEVSMETFVTMGGLVGTVFEKRIWDDDSFRYIWYSESHPEYQGYMDYNPNHITTDGTIEITYYTAGDFKPRSLLIPCKALLVRKPDKNGDYPRPPIGVLAALPDESWTALKTVATRDEGDLVESVEEARRINQSKMPPDL